jgi:hypothetical protein
MPRCKGVASNAQMGPRFGLGVAQFARSGGAVTRIDPPPIGRGSILSRSAIERFRVTQGSARELTDVPQFAIPSRVPPQTPNPVALKELPVQFGYWM